MKMNRRAMLSGAMLGVVAAGANAVGQTQTPTSASPSKASIEARLTELALQNLHPMTFDGRGFSGPGWEKLRTEASASEIVLFGEEHGMVETPILAREMFLALRPAGFDTLAIEISPPIAQELDQAARKGIEGIRAFNADLPPGPAFYFWKTEAEMIAAVRASVPGSRDVLWGLDYEVFGDRRIIQRLWKKAPHQVGPSLTKLDSASQAAWKAWRETHNPGVLFTFSGDPQLVRDVREAWKKPGMDVVMLLDTLEETLEINRLFIADKKGWESNERRSRFMRRNFVAHMDRAAKEGRKPKVMMKMGENHVMRGVSWTMNFDVGSLAHEVATLRGGKAFAFLVGGGQGSHHGVLDPTEFATREAPVDMFEQMGLDFLLKVVTPPGPMVVDLRPMRPPLGNPRNLAAFANPEAMKVIFSFDALVIWNGSTASSMLAQS